MRLRNPTRLIVARVGEGGALRLPRNSFMTAQVLLEVTMEGVFASKVSTTALTALGLGK